MLYEEPGIIEMRPYRARGAARELWSCRDREILMDGPAGTGKTRAILEKMHYCAMKYKAFRGLILRQTRESLTESALVTYEEKVVPEGSPILEGPGRNLRQRYKYEKTGAVIVVGGLDKTSKIMSTEYDMIAIFEGTEVTEDAYEKLLTRLRNFRMQYHQIIVDCNPDNPNHWLNKRAATEQMTRLLSRHEDNPLLFADDGTITPEGEAYISILDRLTGHRHLRLRKGLWCAAEGQVYDKWNPRIHKCKVKFNPPDNWRRIRSIDFGYKNPFVCQWWAIDPDDTMYLYREIYHSHRTVAKHCEQIKTLSRNERYEATVSDHDAEDRATLEENGIYTIPAHKAIRPGIEAVDERMIVQDNGKPRIMIMPNCRVERDIVLVEAHVPTCTEEEFDGYIYPKGVDGKPNKEEPVDKDNHGMDAKRYAVAYTDNLAGMVLRITGEQVSVVK